MKIKIILVTSIVVISLSVSLYFYLNRFNDSNLNELSESLMTNKFITTNTIDEDSNSTTLKTKNAKLYYYTVHIMASDNFISANDQEKLEAMMDITKDIKKYSGKTNLIDSGRKKYAQIKNIIVIGENENKDIATYQMEYDPNKELNQYKMNVSYVENNNYQQKIIKYDE